MLSACRPTSSRCSPTAASPRSLDGWAAEPKLDGWRARVLADDGQVRLRTRSGRDISSSVRSIDRLADRRVVLDGELVAEAGRMEDFYRVGPALARRCQISFVAFDVLWLDGELLTGQPQLERRRILDELGLPVPVIPSFAYDEAPLLFEACGQLGVEGIVLKQLSVAVPTGAAVSRMAEGEGRRLAATLRAPVRPLSDRRRHRTSTSMVLTHLRIEEISPYVRERNLKPCQRHR